VPDVRNRGASGDLLVQVELEVPKKLSERQEELLRELAEEEHANVSEHRKSFFEKVRDFFIPDDLPQPTGSEKEV
jgi:molecular chaperone DnaJ